jgi:hypothetical protein
LLEFSPQALAVAAATPRVVLAGELSHTFDLSAHDHKELHQLNDA